MPFIQGYDQHGYEEEYDDDHISIFEKIKNINNDNNNDDDDDDNVDKLPYNASASEVVKAWGNKLYKIYKECTPRDSDNNIITTFGNHSSIEASNDTIKRITSQSPNKFTSPSKVSFTPTHYNNNTITTDIDWRNELRRFYLAINHPEKVAGIEDILKMWIGKEDQMLSSLLVKYKKIIPQDVYDRLDQIHQLLENQMDHLAD